VFVVGSLFCFDLLRLPVKLDGFDWRFQLAVSIGGFGGLSVPSFRVESEEGDESCGDMHAANEPYFARLLTESIDGGFHCTQLQLQRAIIPLSWL